jgi:hypothetical protein
VIPKTERGVYTEDMRRFDYTFLSENNISGSLFPIYERIISGCTLFDLYKKGEDRILLEIARRERVLSASAFCGRCSLNIKQKRFSSIVSRSLDPACDDERSLTLYLSAYDSIREMKASGPGNEMEALNLLVPEGEEIPREAEDAFVSALNGGVEPLLLIPSFVLDCILSSPSLERHAGLLMLFLLSSSGRDGIWYSSLERVLQKKSHDFEEVIVLSSVRWEENRNDYMPFVRVFLETVAEVYSDVAQLMKRVKSTEPKPSLVLSVLAESRKPLMKSEIEYLLPHVSGITVTRALERLTLSGLVARTEKGYVSVRGECD